jgi:ABC-type sugar transport system substrate-binding protein
MQAAYALSNGEKVEPTKLVNFTLITSENVDKFVRQ